jgi:hypothetical protein
MFFIYIVNERSRRFIVKGGVFFKIFYIKDLFRILFVLEPVLAPEVADARKGTHSGAGKGRAILSPGDFFKEFFYRHAYLSSQ